MKRLLLPAGILFCCAALAAAPLQTTPLDDFEDATPWLKGDPNTDMTQAEVGVRPERQVVHEGKQALAFMVRVDWTPKPGEKYPKGWPMMTRTFKEPQDWSQYDQIEFWLYLQTKSALPKGRVIGFGAFAAGQGDEGWEFPQGLVANQWQKVVVPLHPERDLTHVEKLSFYIAEGWWQDKDRINFLIDDMRLAKYTAAEFKTLSVSPGFGGRGKAIEIRATVAGPTEGVKLQGALLSGRKTEAAFELPLTGKSLSSSVPTPNLSGGNYRAQVKLVDAAGKQLDRREQFLRLPVPGKRTYLSLITFYTPNIMDATAEKLAVLNDSAYAGVAIPIFPGYNADPIPEYESFVPQMKMVRETLKIDPWPWVFGNRLIGRPPDARGHSSGPKTDAEYFKAINIMALDDQTPARDDYLKQFRLAVRMAREWKSPGIVLDLEAYHNYQAYDVAYVAEKRGETVAQVIRGCEKIGEDMARICEAEYPECIVWSLFSHMLNPRHVSGYDGLVYYTPSHIILGFLEYCKQHKLPTKYLCGGEDSPGYYNKNMAALQDRIAARYGLMAPVMERYPDHYFMAGTISPYHDHKILTSWIQNNAGDDPELKTIQDFQPMFRTLFEAYDWLWIYAASASRTEPYKPENSALYSGVLRQALDEAAGGAE
ncbi:MAG: hypothetical protein KKI08_23355 [Armatimonadetes bacterium]|nr:hypothetical protein [Armatimonadota bacterium]